MMDWSALSSRIDQAAYKYISDPVLINGSPRRGMFQAPWTQPRLGSLHTEITEPLILMRDTDIAGVRLGDYATHDGVHYEIVGIEPDGTGVTALILRQAHDAPPDNEPEGDDD